jgi:hypothetical protein
MAHPAIEELLNYFDYKHLPEKLQKVSMHFHTLAHLMVNNLPSNAETTVCLRKLLEAKDCAVRSALSR